MVAPHTNRRLAAILAADVVSYSRLIERDESGTLARLKAQRKKLFEPLLNVHGGRLLKLMGDGMLCEFSSVVDAVRCAIAIQEGMTERERTLPEAERMQLRIGVNLGDVVQDEDGDLYGDGVNVAARLEQLAGPGGIIISGTAYDHLQGTINRKLENLGERRLKNLERPVRVFRVDVGEDVGTETTIASPMTTSILSRKPTIAILPFDNMSGDPEQAFISDGITDDIITALFRFRELQILSSSFALRHRDKGADVKRLGSELGAKYILKGNVRRLSQRIRISAQLIETQTGHHIWAEHFDRSQEEIFAVQDEIIRTIVGTLTGRVFASGAEQARRKPPASLAAYECVLRGAALPFGDHKTDAEKRRMYEQAIALDPEYGLAYARLALVVFLDWYADMTGSDDALDRAFELARKAVVLDEDDSICQYVLGWMHLHRKSFELAEAYFLRTLELNPNDPEVVSQGGYLYAYLGRPDDAIDWLKRARLLDPHFFNFITYWHFGGYAHFIAHRYEDAIAAFSHSSTTPFWVRAYLAASCALAGQIDRAREFAAEVLRVAPDFSSTRLAAKEPFKRPEDREHLLDGLRKAGLPD